MRRLFVFAGLLALAVTAAPAADKPTKVEIGKRGKAATAFVEVPGRGTGTAFCVHPSGLFVTNEHVVRGADKAEITLVLNPSLPDEKVLKARVARTDKALDLALLRVEGAKDLPSLPLGTLDGVAELADVVAVGFPLGRALSPNRKEHPAVSVNAGTVTALRYKGRDLQFIQVDVSLTFGNSGGPVLDENGKVIGVVVSGIDLGRGINQAIPVSRLSSFLVAPDLAFTPPALTPATVGTPVEFKARAAAVLPGAPEPKLKLVLRAGEEAAREFPMTKRDGTWTVSATPAGKAADTRVEVSARLATGTVTGLTEDAVVKVGGKPYRLSALRRIDLGPKPKATLADGRTTVEGAVTGLGPAEIAVGDQKVKFDLSKATQVSVQTAPGITTVTAAVVATVDGREVARSEAKIPVLEPGGFTPATPPVVDIAPPALAEDKVVKRLPEAYADMVLGGGGRYLIFHLPKLKKLAVFDVTELRVTKYIPLPEDKVFFAAGLDAIIVGLPEANRLERWSLTTFEREKSAPPPFREALTGIVMGHAATGLVAVNGFFLDPVTFRQLPILDHNGKEQTGVIGGRVPSADGTVYAAWNNHYSPATSTTFVLEGSTVKRYDGGGMGHVVPGPDGRTVYTGQGVAAATLARADKDDVGYGYCVPAVRGDYFLSIIPSPPRTGGGGFTVYLRGLKLPIARLTKAGHGLYLDGAGGDSYAMWRHVVFIPDAKLIVVLPDSNDQLVLLKFDPDAALAASGLDYLLVTSRPPAAVKAGETLTYPVAVKAKSPKVTYKLDAGPKGMEVSASGVVTWKVPADAAGDHEVILTVADGTGQEVFHTFTVRVAK